MDLTQDAHESLVAVSECAVDEDRKHVDLWWDPWWTNNWLTNMACTWNTLCMEPASACMEGSITIMHLKLLPGVISDLEGLEVN